MEPNNVNVAAAAAAEVLHAVDGGYDVNDALAIAVDPAADEQHDDARIVINTAISILQQRHDFPFRNRNKIVELAQQFVDNLGTDVQEMVTETRLGEDYDGLDSDRDTEDEVRTAIGFYPEVLSQQGGRFNMYPIQCVTYMQDDSDKWMCNVKAASFVHLFARLAIEFNSFEDDERGGLLIEDDGGFNALRRLVISSHASYGETHQRIVDTKFRTELRRLKRSDLFKIEDIQRYHLLHVLCKQGAYFSEQRFRYLTDMHPTSLLQVDENGSLPLHWAWATQSISQFQVMLDAVFRYYPRWKGMNALHQKNNDGVTSFQQACSNFKQRDTDTVVHDAVEDILIRHSTTTTPSLNYDNALITAAIDDTIHLDCVYFLISRQPATMLGILRRPQESITLSSLSTQTGNHGGNYDTSGHSDVGSQNAMDHTQSPAFSTTSNTVVPAKLCVGANYNNLGSSVAAGCKNFSGFAGPELLSFLVNKKDFFRVTPKKFHSRLGRKCDIFTMEDLIEACEEKEYVDSGEMQKCGLKGFNRHQFVRAVINYAIIADFLTFPKIKSVASLHTK